MKRNLYSEIVESGKDLHITKFNEFIDNVIAEGHEREDTIAHIFQVMFNEFEEVADKVGEVLAKVDFFDKTQVHMELSKVGNIVEVFGLIKDSIFNIAKNIEVFDKVDTESDDESENDCSGCEDCSCDKE